MLTTVEAVEIIQALRDLPADRVREVRDFALFLKQQSRSALPVNESDEWTDEDIRDFLVASVEYADRTLPSEP